MEDALVIQGGMEELNLDILGCRQRNRVQTHLSQARWDMPVI